MRKVRYQALGPLLSGEGSRAFLGLEISEDNRARPIVLVWAPSDAAGDPDIRSRLTKETARAAALQHPNIMRVFGLAAVDDGLARIVEFADGETLRKVLDRTGTLPPKFAAFVAAEAAAGVHFAHLTGNADGTPLVHGDIRPETIIVSFNGYAKVSGYGALTVAPKEATGNRVKGRRAHCAPEQILGGREAAIRETDIYLLGILLYECLTGMIPFGEEADFEKAVVTQPLRLVNYDAIPPQLVDVIGRATAKKASDRFPTALTFREALEHAAGGLPTHEEFAAYLKDFFPETDPDRAARRRVIDAGIADLARKQWARAGGQQPPLGGEALGGEPLGAAPQASSVYLDAIPGSAAKPRPPAGGAALGEPLGAAPASSVYLDAIPASTARPKAAPPPPPPQASPPPPPLAPPPERQSAKPRELMPVPGSAREILPGKPLPRPPLEAPLPATDEHDSPRPSARRIGLFAVLVGASLVFGLGGVYWGVSQSRVSRTPPKKVSVSLVEEMAEAKPSPVAATPTPVPTAPATATPPAPAPPAATGSAPPAATAPAPAPSAQPPAAVPAVAAAPAPAPKPPPIEYPKTPVVVSAARPPEPPPAPPPPKPLEPPSLELTVTPPVDVTIDGKAIGRSPVTVLLAPGKHKVSMVEGSKGISMVRTIAVGESGKVRQNIVVGKGTVVVSAPVGAVIFIDGKQVGAAPVPEIPVYEGSHRIMVTMGKAKWQQPFSLRAGENMSFDVQTTN